MALWRILVYRLEDGTCPIRDWYDQQDDEVQALFDASMTILSATADWTDTWRFKVLTKNHAGLGEVRFKLEGPPIRRFRPAGIWPPSDEREFVLLVGCEKWRHVYNPEDAFIKALEYKEKLEAGEGYTDEYF